MCCFNLCFPLHIEVLRREHLCQKREDAEPCERETVSEERSVGGAEVNPQALLLSARLRLPHHCRRCRLTLQNRT